MLLGTELFGHAALAAALCGPELNIKTHPNLGCAAIGPRLTLTKVDGRVVKTINDKPAFDVNHEYFGVDATSVYLLEFPFIIERHGTAIARAPVHAEEGCITFPADIREGESVRLIIAIPIST